VTQLGLGANLPQDAIYPINLFDSTRRPLDGTSKYTIHFDKGATPPVDAFVDHALRQGWVSGRECPQPVRCQQLDAVQVQPGRLAGPLLPERESRTRLGEQLAARSERAIHPDYATVRAEVGGSHRQ